MIPTLFFYELVLVALVWLFLMLCWLWPNDPAARCPTQPQPRPPRKRSNTPKPFTGLTHKPHCALCAQEATSPHPQPPWPPSPMPPTNRRPRDRRHLEALLSPCRLSVSRLAGAGQPARQWPSQRRPLATVPVHRVQGLFLRASWHDFSWQAGGRGADRPRAGVLGRGLGHSGHRAGL